MANDDKKTKATPVLKSEPAPADKGTPGADSVKTESVEKATDSPAAYSRGEGQKPTDKAYRDNWNAIFGKKKPKTGRK
ncbi:MAG: hypothetical protein EXQ91_05575 [Alphaproteobacteria bacterium]|nr:hypothetical protein [Alphaproteobacteria bacterium]